VLLTFAVQGVLIGLAGTLLGALLGTLLADNLQSLVGALEHLLGTQFLDARVYYMSDLPAYVEGIDVLGCAAWRSCCARWRPCTGVARGAHRARRGLAA